MSTQMTDPSLLYFLDKLDTSSKYYTMPELMDYIRPPREEQNINGRTEAAHMQYRASFYGVHHGHTHDMLKRYRQRGTNILEQRACPAQWADLTAYYKNMTYGLPVGADSVSKLHRAFEDCAVSIVPGRFD